ncbi:hypothetical protein F5Y16DRAFT_362584 [Xylariaceae sp. FL0255]|nr:hypothetical protein F5Y16DRAFT_362584 [Xylariaceae sp. FL0255]
MSDRNTFLLFSQLPAEIRRLIWEQALARGRVQLFAKSVPWEDWRLYPPLITRVCRESREVAQSLAVVRGFPSAQDKHNETWFVGSRDVLELSSGYPYPLSNPEPFFAAAKVLAINGGDFQGEFRLLLKDLIEGSRFRSVQVVYLIVDQISTAYWPRFRPDMTDLDKDRGTVLDLSDTDDQGRIEEYQAWARTQEMSPTFPRLEDVQFSVRTSLEEAVMDELISLQRQRQRQGIAWAQDSRSQWQDQNHNLTSMDHPWIREQWQRLPEFRPALLVLGWT